MFFFHQSPFGTLIILLFTAEIFAAIISIQGKHISFLLFNILLLGFRLSRNAGKLTSFPPILNKVREKREGGGLGKGGCWRLYWLCRGWKLLLFFSVGLPCPASLCALNNAALVSSVLLVVCAVFVSSDLADLDF